MNIINKLKIIGEKLGFKIITDIDNLKFEFNNTDICNHYPCCYFESENIIYWCNKLTIIEDKISILNYKKEYINNEILPIDIEQDLYHCISEYKLLYNKLKIKEIEKDFK